jgi:hypothetical protein
MLFDLDAHPWNGREEADEVIRSHRVAAYMCLMRCISPELDYLSAGVKIGDARALYKKIHVRFAKATEEKLREANNSFSRSELRQKPTWDVSQYAGEVVKAAQKISEFGGQEPTEAQQRAALLEGLLPKFDEFVRSLKASVSINRHVMTFEETVAKLCEYEVTANIKGSKTSNEHAFLNVQDGVCKFFSAGKCLKGDSCRYRHETPSLPRGGAKGRAKDKNFKEKIEKVQAKDDDDFPDVIKPKKNANGGFKGNCFGCGDPGHTKRDCPKKKDKSKKDRSDANFADAVDEEWNNMAEEVATEISEILSVTVQGPVMDSGASRTISPNRDDFVPGSLRASPNLKLKFGDGVSSKADGVGTLVVKNPNNNQMVVLYNCILFADCPRTLLSVPQLDSQLQSEIVFKGGRVKVLKGEKVLMSGKKLTDRLYHMDVEW